MSGNHRQWIVSSADIYFSLVRSANDAVVYGKSFKMALNAGLAIIAISVQLCLYAEKSLFYRFNICARNMLFNRLSVHFAQGVKKFHNRVVVILLSLPSPSQLPAQKTALAAHPARDPAPSFEWIRSGWRFEDARATSAKSSR